MTYRPEFARLAISMGAPVSGRGSWWIVLCYTVERRETKAEADELAGKSCAFCCRTKNHIVESGAAVREEKSHENVSTEEKPGKLDRPL
jgi:hypothetical protein